MSFRLAAMLQTVSMTILVAISSANITKPIYKPAFREADPSFLTRSVSNITECIAQCGRWTSCVAINYNRRGNMCYLVHSSAGTGVTIIESKRPGFVSWAKSESERLSSANAHLFTQYDDTRTCEIDTVQGKCKTSACGKPPNSESVNGNVFTAGSKIAYTCYDHFKGVVNMQVITCSADGNWDNIQNICGYTKYNRGGVVYNLKIIDTPGVIHSTAMSNCDIDGATLLAVTTYTSRKHLESILDDLDKSDDYWVDGLKDTDSGDWYTSDGRIIEKGTDIWSNVIFLRDENCAMIETTWGSWKLNEDDCSDPKNYICDMPLMENK